MSTTHTNDASKLAEPDSGSSSGAAAPRPGMFRKLLSLLADVAVYGASSLLSQIISFLLLPLYTEYLDPAQMGVVAMIVLVTSFFGPLANLGMINAIFRRFNVEKTEEERGRVLSSGLYSILISSLTLLGLAQLFAGEISWVAVGDASATALVRIALVSSALSTVGMVPLAVLRADRRVKTIAVFNITKLLISVSSTIWLVVGLEWGIWGMVVGTFIGELTTGVMVLALTARSFRYRGSFAVWKRLAAYGIPFVPHQLQGLVLTLLPQFAIRPLLGLDEVGLYNTALRFTVPVVFIVNSVQNAWTAYKFQIHANDEDPAGFFRTVVNYYVAGVLYLWIGVSLWGPELVWLMTAESYHPAAYLIPIAGLIPVSQGIYFMLGTGMELSDNTRPLPLVTLAGLITTAASVALLMPRLGTSGAAVSSVNAFIAMTVVIYYFAQRRFRINYDWALLARLLALGAAAGVLGYLLRDLPLWQRLAGAVAISVAFPLVEFWLLSRSDAEAHRMRILWDKVARKLRFA